MWNGNNLVYNDTSSGYESDYDAITPSADWMVENGTACINADNPITILDEIGYITTPPTGYTEPAIGGTDIQFHGPFQRWMLVGDSTAEQSIKNTGNRIHLMRQFYCAEDESTFSISYQYVYCRSFDKRLENILYLDVNGKQVNYTWYHVDGYGDGQQESAPYNFSNSSSYTIDGATSFYNNNGSNMFECLNDDNDNRVINTVPVSYEYPYKVNATDPILVHIYTRINIKKFWFMVGGVSVDCTPPTPAPTLNPTDEPVACERRSCSDLLRSGSSIWGFDGANGVYLGNYTNQLQWIGCYSDCPFFCNDNYYLYNSPTFMTFGVEESNTLRALLGSGSFSDTTPSCASSNYPRGIMNAPDKQGMWAHCECSIYCLFLNVKS